MPLTKGPSINVIISKGVQTIYFLSPPLPPKKSTHQNFVSANIPIKIIKILPKSQKCTEKNVDFHRPPPSPEAYGLYTRENVDIYRRSLNMTRKLQTGSGEVNWHNKKHALFVF